MLPDQFLLRHSSIDAYLFVRFLRVIMILCILGCCLTWPVLFPVNATGGGGASQLDKIAFGNVADKTRLYAHAVVAWVFCGLVILIITRERLFATNLRQVYASQEQNAHRLSSRTVLFLSVPADAHNEDRLQHYFGDEAVRSWHAPNVDDLQGLVGERSAKIDKLEQAELQFEKNITKQSGSHNTPADSRPETGSGGKAAQRKARPVTKSYYVFGEQVDTLDTLRKEIPDLESKIKAIQERETHTTASERSALFVEFKDQASALEALQQVRQGNPLSFQPRISPVQPKEVLWANLNLDPSVRITYSYLAIAFIAATIILWSIPVGIVGTISNISNLTNKIRWLRFIDNLPDPVLGLLTGFLPPLILSTFVSYVPYFFRCTIL